VPNNFNKKEQLMGTVNNLYIDQGATFSAIVQIYDDAGNPFNLAGYTPSAQIRRNYATNTVSATFSTGISEAANGTISLALPAEVSGNLKYGRYVYDVEITSGNVVLRPIEGIITVYPQVTR
jgi:hypothetical protein